MSFSTTNTENLYTCDGLDSTFSVTFNYEDASEIKADKIDYTDPDAPITTALVLNSTFTFDSGTNILTTVVTTTDGSGNPVYTATPLSAVHKLRIYRQTIDYHQAVYTTYQFPYATATTDFDRVFQRLQELNTELTRKIGLTPASTMNGLSITGEELIEMQTILTSMQASGGALPSGGAIYNYLEAGAAGTGEWVNGTFSGYSARYGASLTLNNLRDALLYIFNFSYVAPSISLSSSVGTSIREKGTSTGPVTLTATTTKTTNDITLVDYYRNGGLIHTEAAPIAAGGTETYADSVTFTDTTSFYARAGDGTSNTTSNTITYTFVYPYYYGAGASGLTAAQVAALTKDVISSDSDVTYSFTIAVGQKIYMAYPASYGALTSILDSNGFETIGDWTLRTENITGLDTTAQSYRIYEFNNTFGAAVTTTYRFRR